MCLPHEIKPAIFLDNLSTDHAQDYYSLLQHAQIKPFIPSQCVPDDVASAKQELYNLYLAKTRGTGHYWGIFCDNQLIGTCGLHSLSSPTRTIEVSYELHPHYWNRGIATASVEYLIERAPQEFKIDKILCFTLAQNLPSQKVALKAGFKRVAYLKRDCYFNGQLVDRILFEITL